MIILAGYVNDQGQCFVAQNTLAEDCELSVDTIRRWLVWLENVGAIRRAPQWLNCYGSRTNAGRGRRTTDLIQLRLDADPKEIERRACGELDRPAVAR
jgi:Helix-turn-helix domain